MIFVDRCESKRHLCFLPKDLKNTILSTCMRPNHSFVMWAFVFVWSCFLPEAIFCWQAWIQTIVRFYRVSSSQLRPLITWNTILSTGVGPNHYFVLLIFAGFWSSFAVEAIFCWQAWVRPTFVSSRLLLAMFLTEITWFVYVVLCWFLLPLGETKKSVTHPFCNTWMSALWPNLSLSVSLYL